MMYAKTLIGCNLSPAEHSKDLSFTLPRRGPLFPCSLSTRKAFVNPSNYRFNRDTFSVDGDTTGFEKEREVKTNADDDDIGRREEKRISGIHVPRKKHISISKEELLEAILEMFGSEDADCFLKLSVCLDSILHAEHKTILEEMRSYYPSHFQDQIQRTKYLTQTGETASIRRNLASNGSIGKETNFTNKAEDDKGLYLQDSLDLRIFFGSISGITNKKSSIDPPRIAVANRFQQSFMKLLYDAQFEELSAEDLLMTKALNSDYLLTLPIYVDWKRASESHAIIFRQNFLQRITLGNLWEPASSGSCGGNVWKMLKTAVSILFSKSILQEPAFEELILLYTEEPSQREDKDEYLLPLHLKIYEKIPIPDLPVIFPHKKLSFRILDSLRLDIASILGLLAFFLNYKFENILSSPSAVLLDAITSTALIAFLSRVVLGYKQTWDRYQLLVNRTLYEKTLASGFGSVYFLLDASEQQQYKEAILLYAILLQEKKYQVLDRKSIGAECEMFLYEKFTEQIDMPVDKAMDTLKRMGLVSEFPPGENFKAEAISCSQACDILRKRWNRLLDL